MPRGEVIWVGERVPPGLDARRVASLADVPPDAGVVVLECPPAAVAVEELVPPEQPLVVCVPCLDPWSVRRWSGEGAYCLCLEHVPAEQLGRWLERVQHEHEATTALRLRRLATRIDSARFSVATLEEAESLAEVLARLLPEPMRRLAGLVELLVNAVEHGNLGISGAEKKQLLRSGQWQQEIRRRACTAPWGERVVVVSFERTAREWVLTIEDEGAGFNPSATPGDPTSLNGRGLSLARAAFDSLVWEGRGNRVVARVRRHG
ncbi:MAG: ATP-binding protein [Myxococcota bacterium]